MLTKLLSRSTCAACRLCCHFDGYDIWNTPVLTEDVRRTVQSHLPQTTFLPYGTSSYLFRLERQDADGSFPCPLLDPQTGCILGDEKPFTCRIWPFCIMQTDGRQVITVAPLCDAVLGLSLETLLSFLKEDLAGQIFAYAAAYPDVVQVYDPMYPILMWKPEHYDNGGFTYVNTKL